MGHDTSIAEQPFSPAGILTTPPIRIASGERREPWTLTALISFVVSFYASARSLQIGLAVEVVAIASVAANLSAILGGILVFGEPIGSGPVGITARLLAFGLVIAGAALMPAPLPARADTA